MKKKSEIKPYYLNELKEKTVSILRKVYAQFAPPINLFLGRKDVASRND